MKPTSLQQPRSFTHPSQALLESTLPTPQSSLKSRNRWQKLQDWLYDWFIATNEPKIKLQRSRTGLVYWSVYDPVSRDRVRFASEAEVRTWLEQRYYD